MDPQIEEGESDDQARVEIARIDKDENGTQIQTIVHKELFGPPDEEERKTFKEKFSVDWDDAENHHVINVYSESGNPLSFTLAAQKQTPLSKHCIGCCINNDWRLCVHSDRGYPP